MSPITLTLVASLAASSPVVATIVHTVVDVPIPHQSSHVFDLTGDGVDNFSLSFVDLSYGWTMQTQTDFESVDGGTTQAAVHHNTLRVFIHHQSGPASIGPSFDFAANPYPFDSVAVIGTPPAFPLYLGLQTSIGTETHYGWVQLDLEYNPRTLRVVDFAYESIPDMPIVTGTIPAPGALGLLAVGALAAARRRR